MFNISMFGEDVGEWAPVKQRKNWSGTTTPHIKMILDTFDATVNPDVVEDLEKIVSGLRDFFLTVCFDGDFPKGRVKPKIAEYKNGATKDIVVPPLLPDIWTVSLKITYEPDDGGDTAWAIIPYNFGTTTSGTSTQSLITFAKAWNEAYYEMLKDMCERSNKAKEHLKLNRIDEQKKKIDAELAELERLAKKHKKILADK